MRRKFTRYNHETGEVEEFYREDSPAQFRPQWPLKSESAGVHPSQIEEATAFSKSMGVPTEYTPSGRPVFTSAGHRRKYLKAWRMHDRSGFD